MGAISGRYSSDNDSLNTFIVSSAKITKIASVCRSSLSQLSFVKIGLKELKRYIEQMKINK